MWFFPINYIKYVLKMINKISSPWDVPGKKELYLQSVLKTINKKWVDKLWNQAWC